MEADDAEQAIQRFAEQADGEVTSTVRSRAGNEVMATMRKEDTVYLLRVSAA